MGVGVRDMARNKEDDSALLVEHIQILSRNIVSDYPRSPEPVSTITASRHRIHREAGSARGVGGRTQNLRHRVRRKWSPSGDGGALRRVELRTCLCGTQGLQGKRKLLPRRSSGENAEGPQLRASTAERGAGKRHIFLLNRGNFQRPVRVSRHGQTTGFEAA
jgi:hypothetical protein